MIYKHKRSGDLYRFLMPVFDVNRQADAAIYVSLQTGVLFSRDSVDFDKKFEFVKDPQREMTPRPKMSDNEKDSDGRD